jgi:hypothetical protein
MRKQKLELELERTIETQDFLACSVYISDIRDRQGHAHDSDA